MSAKIAKRVLGSALPAHLKPAAVVMALYGDEQGECIYPSVGRVAHLLSISASSVKRHLRQLRDLGVLVPTPETTRGGRLPGGHRGRSTVYQLNVAALPARPDYAPRTGDVGATGTGDTDAVKGVTGDPVENLERVSLTTERVSPTPLRVSFGASKGVTGDPRSSDLIVRRIVRKIGPQTGANAPGFSLAEENTEEPDAASTPDTPSSVGAAIQGDAAMNRRADEPRAPEPLRDPPRPLSDDELLRRRRDEWKQKAETLDVAKLRADAERIAADERRRKTGSGDDER